MEKRTCFLFIGISLIALCIGICFLGVIVIGYWLLGALILCVVRYPEKFIKDR